MEANRTSRAGDDGRHYLTAILVGLVVAVLIFAFLSAVSAYGWGPWWMSPMGHRGGYGSCHAEHEHQGMDQGMGHGEGPYGCWWMHSHCMEECEEHMESGGG